MVIEMIPGQVGENTDVKGASINPVLIQGMG
jgi:hypothetical protein